MEMDSKGVGGRGGTGAEGGGGGGAGAGGEMMWEGEEEEEESCTKLRFRHILQRLRLHLLLVGRLALRIVCVGHLLGG